MAKLREILTRDAGIGIELRYVSNQTSLASPVSALMGYAGMVKGEREVFRKQTADSDELLDRTAGAR
jgi:hypothetical protein